MATLEDALTVLERRERAAHKAYVAATEAWLEAADSKDRDPARVAYTLDRRHCSGARWTEAQNAVTAVHELLGCTRTAPHFASEHFRKA